MSKVEFVNAFQWPEKGSQPHSRTQVKNIVWSKGLQSAFEMMEDSQDKL